MGIPGILKEIGKGERVALSKLAIEHLECTNRPLRIAIDAAIWNFQHQASQGGKNPALRTLFFRLLKLLALPINPVFVYDGKNKPLTKRGKTVSRYGTSIENESAKRLISAFRFPHHTAPGEAEAECALLQRKGIVDAVMSQDVDAIMFGSTLTLRDWSKEGTKGNKTPTHVDVLKLDRIKQDTNLDPDGMILVAMLSGGDYNEAGVAGFGPGLACEIARAGFGSDLLDSIRKNDLVELQAWRDRLNYELQMNESGYFRTKHSKLVVPSDFPDRTVLDYYMTPVVSELTTLPELQKGWEATWKSELDVVALRKYTADMFDWNWKSGCRSFIRRMAQPLFQHRLLRSATTLPPLTPDCVTEARQHFTTDGTLELRLAVVPAQCVEVDLEAEDDNPEYSLDDALPDVEEEEVLDTEAPVATTTNFFGSRKQPWNPLNPEKWWVPQTLLQYGLPVLVEEWQQKQRDIEADPKKFAARKALKSTKAVRAIDTSTKAGSIHAFLEQAPKTTLIASTEDNHKPKNAQVIRSPRRVRNNRPVDAGVPLIAQFFRPQKARTDNCREEMQHLKENETKERREPPSPIFSVPDFDESQDGEQSEPQEITRLQFQCSNQAQRDPIIAEAETERSLTNVTRRKKRGSKSPSKSLPFNDQMSAPNASHAVRTDSCVALVDEEQEPVLKSRGKFHTAAGITEILSQSTLVSTQLSVASRESLPGAWTKAKSSTANKRSRKVSYVDLTGD